MEIFKEKLTNLISERQKAEPENVCNDFFPRLFGLEEMEEAKAELDRTGVVVFRDVIDASLQSRYINAVWAWLHRSSCELVRREDPETWGNNMWPNSLSPGIQAREGLCHLPEAWEVRERAAPFFEGIYSDSELLVSFDGANIMRPTVGPGGKEDYLTAEHWLHVDSNGSAKPEKSGYQGVVQVGGMDGTEGQGGSFQAVLGSHTNDFEEFMAEDLQRMYSNQFRNANQQFRNVPQGHRLRKRMVKVIAPDRSLVIWKNEIFHCNAPNRSSKFRYAQYVNFCPGSLVDEATRTERLEAFLQGVGSTHWVHEFWPSSHPCRDYVPPALTKKQRDLLGSGDE